MEYFIGIVLALSVGLFGTFTGLDRDRAYYSTVAIVVASYYALFAVMGGSVPSLVNESLAIAVFIGLAVAGFRRSPWLVVVALVGHGVFDLVHGRVIDNPGVPAWWPGFCLAFDVVAGAYLARLLQRSKAHAATA